MPARREKFKHFPFQDGRQNAIRTWILNVSLMAKKLYSDQFFENRAGALESAKHLVPLVLNLVHAKSVVDVGCGTGDFLSVFKEEGVDRILGVDGQWVDKKNLRIPEEFFLSADLEKPLEIGQTFDLVISLEVAEHLKAASAETFIESLTCLGPVILFSAAIPFQGGVHHVNEQWPEYWIERFTRRGYVVIDCIRRAVWNNLEVSVWYAQNTFLFVYKDHLKHHPKLQKELEKSTNLCLSLVHPRLYEPKARMSHLVLQCIPSPIQRFAGKLKRLMKA